MGPLFIQVTVGRTLSIILTRLFTYALPRKLEQVLVPGMRVMAPFGAADKERVCYGFSIGSTRGRRALACFGERLTGGSRIAGNAGISALDERYYCTIFEAIASYGPTRASIQLKDSYFLEAGFTKFRPGVFYRDSSGVSSC